MESCSVCSEITKYRCIICNIFICNRNPNCHVSVGEEEEGWQMGLRVALCHPCHNARNNLPNNGESSVINPGTGNTQESNPFTSPPTSSLEGLRKFEIDCASWGFHFYREIWNPRIGEKLEIEQEYGNVEDPFAMAIKAKPRFRVRFWETVGHIPREISRFCHYFINYGGFLEGRVSNPRYRPSPIPSGGLEIPIRLVVKRNDSDYRVFQKMKNLLKEYYMEPDHIPESIQFAAGEVEEQEEEFGPQDEGNVGNEEDVEEVLSSDENDETIVIDDD